MEEGGINMRGVYILLVLVIAASALGCIGKKPSESITVPGSTETPVPSEGISENGDSGIESDLAQMDSMFNESIDISLSEVSADAFT